MTTGEAIAYLFLVVLVVVLFFGVQMYSTSSHEGPPHFNFQDKHDALGRQYK